MIYRIHVLSFMYYTPNVVDFIYLQDAGGQGIGFLLGSLNVKYALTSEACHKSLSKTASGEVVQFKGV